MLVDSIMYLLVGLDLDESLFEYPFLDLLPQIMQRYIDMTNFLAGPAARALEHPGYELLVDLDFPSQ